MSALKQLTESDAFPAALPKFIPELDGLRGLAVLGVLLVHSQLPARLQLDPITDFGWMGVDCFFVLSGFLITGILVDSYGANNYFRVFYARRTLRIFPLYYAFLVLVYVVPLLRGMMLHPSVQQYHWWWYTIYAQNIVFPDLGPRPVIAAWSLAVEEQFYLMWPVVIWIATPRRLGRVLVGVIVGAILLRVAAALALGETNLLVFGSTPCRADSLCLGGLLAWAIRFRPQSAAIWRRRSYAAFLAGAASVFLISSGSVGLHTLVFSALGVTFCGVVGLAIFPDSEMRTPAILRNKFLAYIGRISYGVYLLHMPVFALFEVWAMPKLAGLESSRFGILVLLILQIGLVSVVASVSWWCFELPILSLKQKLSYRFSAAEIRRSPGATSPLFGSGPQATHCTKWLP